MEKMKGSKILHSWEIVTQSPTREGFYDPLIFSIRNYHTPSLTCLIKKQLKQLNIKFLMKSTIVQMPIAMEQIVPNFSKEVMV